MDVVVPCVIGAIPVYGDVCIRKQRRKRQKKLLVLLFLDYAKNTTLHGLRYITERSLHIIEKIFWVVTFFVSLSVCSYFIFEVWRKWNASPVIVSFNARHVSVEEVPFPSVTICPQTKVLSHVFNYTKAVKLKDSYREQGEFDLMKTNESDLFEAANIVTLICDSTEPFMNKPEYFNATDVLKLIEASGRTSHVFEICQWQGKGEYCSDLFKKVLTKNGICYNFNGLQAEDIFNENVQTDYNYTLTAKKISNWSMNKNYKGFKNKTDNYPKRDRLNIDRPSLMLILKGLDHRKDQKCNSIYNGYKIYLHHPADYPQALLYHFAAIPQQMTSMAIKFVKETANPELEDYPVEKRQCYFPKHKRLTYFRHYTYHNCMLECLTKYVFKRCGCVAFYMPFDNSSRICTSSLNHTDCLMASEDQFIGSLDENDECQCLPECNSIKYDAEIHKTNFLVGNYFEAQYGDKEEIRNIYNFSLFQQARVEIFYKEPTFRSVHRSVLFGTSDFLANCGGLLGLFLGFSWLSLVEIFYFLTFRVYKTIKNDLKQEKSEEAKK